MSTSDHDLGTLIWRIRFARKHSRQLDSNNMSQIKQTVSELLTGAKDTMSGLCSATPFESLDCANLSISSYFLRAESVGRDRDGVDSPGLAVVGCHHVASDAFALAESVDVVGICDVQDDGGVQPLVSTHATTVGLCALDSTAEALGLSVLGGKCGDHFFVDENCLGVVAGRVVVLVCNVSTPCACIF